MVNRITAMMSFGLTGILGTLVLSTHGTSASPNSNKTLPSAVALMVMCLLLGLSMGFRVSTHTQHWSHDEQEDEQYWGHYESEDDVEEMEPGSQFLPLNIPFITAFATGLAIPCSYAMLRAFKDSYANTAISEHVLSVIILPLLANTPAFHLGLQAARRSQFDVGIHLNYVVGVEVPYVMASFLILMSLIHMTEVPFESAPAELVLLGMASITSHRVMTSSFLTYFHGALCLGL